MNELGVERESVCVWVCMGVCVRVCACMRVHACACVCMCVCTRHLPATIHFTQPILCRIRSPELASSTTTLSISDWVTRVSHDHQTKCTGRRGEGEGGEGGREKGGREKGGREKGGEGEGGGGRRGGGRRGGGRGGEGEGGEGEGGEGEGGEGEGGEGEGGGGRRGGGRRGEGGSQVSVTHLFDESKVLRESSHSIEPADHTQGYIPLTVHLGTD